jgi:hypothetical protein
MNNSIIENIIKKVISQVKDEVMQIFQSVELKRKT